MREVLPDLRDLLDPERLAALHATGLLDTEREETFDRFTRLAAQLLAAPAAVLALVTDDRQFFKSDFGLDPGAARQRETSLALSLCKHAVIRRQPLQVRDVRSDPELDVDRSSLARLQVISYAGAPIITAAGHAIGTLGVIDRRPRTWTPREITGLEDLAAAVRTEIELRIDAAARDRAQAAVEASERRYRLLFQRNVAGVFRSTMDGTILEANDAFAEMLGFSGPGAVERVDALDFYEDPAHRKRLVQILDEEGRIVNQEVRVLALDGSPRWLLVTASLIEDRESGERHILGTVFDVTDRKRIEEQLRRRALFDELTELPNRSLFEDRLRHALARVRRGDGRDSLAVLFIDVDRFKVVNDSLGHETGDWVLSRLAQRLAQTAREEDTVARFGGDEFTVLLEDLSAREDAVRAAERLAGVFDAPFVVSGEEFSLSASIGIALHDGSAEVQPGDLVRRGDIAMYRAKETGGTSCYVLEPGVDTAETTRLQREGELRRAIREDRFHLLFQPLFDLGTGALLGAEALVRWDHPERGVLAPGDFIPLAEETGQIVALGTRILEMACREAMAWTREGGVPARALKVYVNLSPRELAERDYIDRVWSTLEAAGATPERVCLEVTESLLTEAPQRIRELRALGLQVVVDDFGTGYSSLSYLGRMTVDALKIDSSFVRDLVDDPRNQAIVQSIVTLGETLSLDVIAEGIEEPEQAEVIRRLGCRIGQGFYLERPLPAGAFRELARAGR